MILALAPAAAADEYIYGDADPALPFEVSYSELRAANTPEKARRVFRRALGELTDADVYDQFVVDGLMSLAEECIRFTDSGKPGDVALDMMDSASQRGVRFRREPRIGVTYSSDDEARFKVESVGDLGGDIDFVYLDAPFGALRLDARGSGTVGPASLRRLGADADGPPTALSSAAAGWSIWASLAVMAVSICVEPLRRRAAMRWAVLAACLMLFSVNALTARRAAATDEPEEDGIEVEFQGDAAAILSFPIEDDRDRDLAVFNEDGEPVPCKYNPVTGMVDARVTADGKYYVALSAVYFTDIDGKSAEMRSAIRALTSRGLMAGADERKFLPDREITRAEFLSVVLRVMDLLDEDAQCSLPDVLRSDWFYSVAASAEKERLISGYEDNTFRGNEPILKVQMASIAGNALMRMMDYERPDDADEILRVYTDSDDIPTWARDSVALAAFTGVVPTRADGSFGGGDVMTRGDASVMLYRLFVKIW
ncbi:MAG: S-layer homology domain-containing protein [Oscillospiraceae bacterium]|nr:S-layer homology domain-containing protein [Oscillospiraceae bacterium]